MNAVSPPEDRIARWLAREVFGEARIDVVSLRVLDGTQALTDYSLNAGDDAPTIARELAETLATYYDGDKRGHTFHVQAIFRDGIAPRIGKLAVKMTPEAMEATGGLARVSMSELAHSAQSTLDAKAPLESWKAQAQFNVQQNALLTATVVTLARSTGEQWAAVLDATNSTLAAVQKALEDRNAEVSRLRAELADKDRVLNETRELAELATKQVEELADKLKEEKESSKMFAPIMRELTAGVGEQVAKVVGGVVNGAARSAPTIAPTDTPEGKPS